MVGTDSCGVYSVRVSRKQNVLGQYPDNHVIDSGDRPKLRGVISRMKTKMGLSRSTSCVTTPRKITEVPLDIVSWDTGKSR